MFVVKSQIIQTECNNAMPPLFRSNNSDLQNSTGENKKNVFQQPRGPISPCGCTPQRLFVERVNLEKIRRKMHTKAEKT